MGTNMTNWKRNIALFLSGQGITLFGSMLVHYAIMWHITLQTQSGLMVTLITAAGTLPMFFISPFAGVWADRYNKKNMINIADALIAVITLGIAIVFSRDMVLNGLLVASLAVRSLGQGIQMPAVNALVPELVPQEHLIRVNGISGGIQSMVMFASPLAGGALLMVAPIHILLLIDVVTAMIGIGILQFWVKIPERTQVSQEKVGARQYFHEMAEGITYIRKKTLLKKFMILNAIFNIMVAPVAVMTPLQVARDFGDGIWNIFRDVAFGPEQRLASIESVYFIGMVAGSLAISVWGGFKNKSHTMALSTVLLGVGTIGLGVITDFWIYLLFMGLTGVVMSLFNPPMMTVLQTNVENAYMGRVFSVLTMISSLMMPLSMVLWGPLGDAVAIDWLLIGTGIAMSLMCLFFMFDKTLLAAGKPEEREEQA